MKSLKISLVLFFALLLCSSCVGNDRKDTDSDTKRPESSAVESNTDTKRETDTDMANDGVAEPDTDSQNDTDAEISERTRRMRARARKQVEHWIRQVQNTADAYLR